MLIGVFSINRARLMPEAAYEYVGNRWFFFLLTRRKAGRIAKIAKDNKRKPELEARVVAHDRSKTRAKGK
jgi:hypothetical protein